MGQLVPKKFSQDWKNFQVGLTELVALWASLLLVDFDFSLRIIKESYLSFFTKLQKFLVTDS